MLVTQSNNEVLANLEYNCAVCPEAFTHVERQQCVHCSEVIAIATSLYMPANLTKGDYGHRKASAQSVWKIFLSDFVHHSSAASYTVPVALNATQKTTVAQLFPDARVNYNQMLPTRFDFKDIVCSMFMNIVKRATDAVDLVHVTERNQHFTTCSRYSDFVSFDDYVDAVSRMGVRTDYIFVPVSLLNKNDVRFLKDNDCNAHGRVYHYRIMSLSDDMVFALLIAVGDCAVAEQSVDKPIDSPGSVTKGNSKIADKAKFIVVPDFDHSSQSVEDLLGAEFEKYSGYLQYLPDSKLPVDNLTKSYRFYLINNYDVIADYYGAESYRIAIMGTMFVSGSASKYPIGRHSFLAPTIKNFNTKYKRAKAIVNFIQPISNKYRPNGALYGDVSVNFDGNAKLRGGGVADDNYCYQKLFIDWPFVTRPPALDSKLIADLLAFRDLDNYLDNRSKFTFIKHDAQNFHVEYSNEGFNARDILVMMSVINSSR